MKNRVPKFRRRIWSARSHVLSLRTYWPLIISTMRNAVLGCIWSHNLCDPFQTGQALIQSVSAAPESYQCIGEAQNGHRG